LPQLAHYDVLDELGRGGAGVVYRARQRMLQRLVALKMMARTIPDPDDCRRFRAEAEIIARLRHPHIVQIFEVGEYRGQPFLALELVEGGSLREQLARGRPNLPQAVRLVEKLARAVAHAHASGIVHRDLKPGNILLTPDGEPRITDFGVAKLLDAQQEKTQTGAVIGTPEYMAPEQAEGEVRRVGPLTDIYALGVILYELLTGRRPIEGGTAAALLARIGRVEPAPLRRWLPGAPADLEAVCQKCLEKEPQRRYASADDLADDLRHFLQGKPVSVRPVGPLRRFGRWCRRQPWPAALLGLAALFVLSLAIAAPAMWLLYTQAVADRRQAENQNAEALRQTVRAQEQEREARHQVVRLHAGIGGRLMDDGDYLPALAWITDALSQEARGTQDPARLLQPLLRRQAAGLLQHCPCLVGQSPVEGWVHDAAPPGGRAAPALPVPGGPVPG
jgi:predicted Ser/Thr protein kinase